MAGKKPAKRNVSNAKEIKVELPGKALKYVGSKNAKPFICPSCQRSLIKGIIYEDNGSTYCSRRCIPTKVMETV